MNLEVKNIMPTCLIVDDTDVNRMVARRMVEHLGFMCDDVSNINDAWEKLTQQDFDVLLLDWYMPDLDGITFLRHLRKTSSGKGLCVFIYSGVEGESGRKKALEAGADNFIPKPATKEAFHKVFHRAGLLQTQAEPRMGLNDL